MTEGVAHDPIMSAETREQLDADELHELIQKARTQVQHVKSEVREAESKLRQAESSANEFVHHVQAQSQAVVHTMHDTAAAIGSYIQQIEAAVSAMEITTEGKLTELTKRSKEVLLAFKEMHTNVDAAIQSLKIDGRTLIARCEHGVSEMDAIFVAMGQRLHHVEESSLRNWSITSQKIRTAMQSTVRDTRQQFNAVVEQRLVQTSRKVEVDFQRLSREFDRAAQTLAQNLRRSVQGVAGTFMSEQHRHSQDLVNSAQRLSQGVSQVIETIKSVGKTATRSMDQVVNDLGAVNVGFKVTIGTLDNVQDTLREIHL